MDWIKLREDFPLLREGKLIYFDWACQSLRPLSVVKKMEEYLLEYPACGERSLHRLGQKVTEEVEKSRKIVADFLGAKSSEIVFTKNATEALNLVIRGINLPQGAGLLTSEKEHNSLFLPLLRKASLEKRKIFIVENHTEGFNFEKFEKILKQEKIGLVGLGLVSNVDGSSIPAKQIIGLAHKHKVFVILDAVQAVTHQKIEVKKLGIDFLAISGHKIFGPSGVGALFGKKELLEKLEPLIVGGGTVENLRGEAPIFENYKFFPLPQKLEAGLQNYAGILGLGEALKWLEKIGLQKIEARENELSQKLSDILKERGAKIIGTHSYSSIRSFYFTGIDSHRVCLLLDKTFGILTRSGNFCNHFYFQKRKLPPALRVSLNFLNTEEDLDKLKASLQKILEVLK